MNGWKLVFRRGLVLFFVGMVGLMIGGLWWASGTGDENISPRSETGRILDITPVGEYGKIHLRRDGYEAYVTLDGDTLIMKGSPSRIVGFGELRVGDLVEVVVPEVILEIYPYQYGTTRVRILE